MNGDYILRVQVHNYQNTFNTCAQCPRINSVGTCCDDQDDTNGCEAGDRCDNVFFYCLMPLGSVPSNSTIFSLADENDLITRATGLGCLQPSTALRSDINENGDTINFFNPSGMVLGLSSPLEFEVTAVRWQVSVLTQLLNKGQRLINLGSIRRACMGGQHRQRGIYM